MRAIIAALLCAGLGAAGAAWGQSQPPPPPRPNGLVFHVAMSGPTPTVSLGMAQPAAAGAVLRQRREMQGDCTWSQASDLTVPADTIVPLRDPNQMGGAEGFGSYYATLFSALVSAKGGTPTADQLGCIRRTMTTMAANLLQRRAQTGGTAPQAATSAPASAPAQPPVYTPVPLYPPR